MNGRPELVACDLDGTLFDEKGAAAPGVVAAVAELRAAGARVVICSGRTVGSTRAAAARLGLRRGVAIGYHGAVVFDLADGRWLCRLDLPREAVGPVVETLHGAGAQLTAYVDDERWVQAAPTSANAVGVASAQVRVHSDLAAALKGQPVTRIIVEVGDDADPEPLASMLAVLARRWRELAVSCAPGGRLEVHHADADKRAALAALCERLGVQASAVVACGDGAGDASMLQWAGLGVAVAEGDEPALAAADVIVARTEIAELLVSLAGRDREPRLG